MLPLKKWNGNRMENQTALENINHLSLCLFDRSSGYTLTPSQPITKTNSN